MTTDVPLYRHWAELYRKRGLILATSLFAALAAWGFSQQVTPMYESKTTFFMPGNATQPAFDPGRPDAAPEPLLPIPEEKAAALDIGILRGREVMEALARQFDLPVAELNKRVDATVSGEFMIELFVRNPDPVLAAEIANAVPQIYRDFHKGSMRRRAETVAQAMQARLIDLQARRAALEARLLDHQRDTLSTTDAAYLDRLQGLRDKARANLETIDGEILGAQARRDALDRLLQDEGAAFAAGQTTQTTAALEALQERVVDLRVVLAGVQDGKVSPRRTALERQIESLTAEITQERARLAQATAKPRGSLFENLRLERALLTAQLADLDAAREAAQGRVDAAALRFEQALEPTAEVTDIKYQLSRISQSEVQTAESLAVANLQSQNAEVPLVIVERAVAPLRAMYPLTTLNTIVAGICGLIFGAYYALFVAHAERARAALRAQSQPLPVFTQDELRRLRAGDLTGNKARGRGDV